MIVSMQIERDIALRSGAKIQAAGIPPFDTAALLFLPLRTMRGAFAWVSSDLRIRSAFSSILAPEELEALMTAIEETLCRASAAVSTRSGIVSGRIGDREQLILEQFPFTAERQLMIDRLGEAVSQNFFSPDYELSWWREKSRNDLAILREEHFVKLLLAVEGPDFVPQLRRSGRIPGDSILWLAGAGFDLANFSSAGTAAAVLTNERRPPAVVRLKKVETISLPLVEERQSRPEKTPAQPANPFAGQAAPQPGGEPAIRPEAVENPAEQAAAEQPVGEVPAADVLVSGA